MKFLPVMIFLTSTLIAASPATAQKKQGKSKAKSDSLHIIVYKSPTCGCCTKWEDHLRNAGFSVDSRITRHTAQIKKRLNVPRELQSCHTGIINNYIVEGHVPASDIKRMLKEKPDIVGLTAPGMPQESPGMQPEGKKPANYDVLSFTRDGKTKVYTSY